MTFWKKLFGGSSTQPTPTTKPQAQPQPPAAAPLPSSPFDYEAKKAEILHIAATHGRIKVIDLGLSLSTEGINYPDSEGNTALHMAAKNGHLEVAQRLVDAGANKTAKNNAGMMPLEVASSPAMIEFLRSALATKQEANVAAYTSPTGRSYTGQFIELTYFGMAACSDDDCPCSGSMMPPDQGYMFIAPEVADFRQDCLSMEQLQRKLEPLKQKLGGIILMGGKGQWIPFVVCETSARSRNLNLKIAADDFNYWVAHQKIPCRATPLQ